MREEKLYLFQQDPNAFVTAWIQTFKPSEARPAMIICPGGGYHFLSDRESEPIALRYLQAGFNVFILNYSVGALAKDYLPIIEATLTVRYVREHAADFSIDAGRVYIVGFSAGGHLAASTGTLFDAEPVKSVLADSPEGISIPNGMVLCYPVITSGVWAHRGSFDWLCGSVDAGDEERARFSLENFVSDKTPPTFIWHTSPDQTVPVMNSLLFAEQLAKHHIPFEMRVYPEGGHGLATGDLETNSRIYVAREWVEQSVRWIKGLSG